MADEYTDEELDRRVAALIGSGHCGSGRQRGRPADGVSKALKYSGEYFELCKTGIPSWTAMQEVADRNRKTIQHIAASVRLVHEYILEPDRDDDA